MCFYAGTERLMKLQLVTQIVAPNTDVIQTFKRHIETYFAVFTTQQCRQRLYKDDYDVLFVCLFIHLSVHLVTCYHDVT